MTKETRAKISMRLLAFSLMTSIQHCNAMSMPMGGDMLPMIPSMGTAPAPFDQLPVATQTSPSTTQPVEPQGGSTAPTYMLDTVEYPEEKIGIQGNWQKKRGWLMQANDLCSREIEPLIAKIYATRNQFNQQFNGIDQALDDFYKEIGLEQGKLQELFKSIEHYIDKKKQQQLAELLKNKETLNLSERDYTLKAEDVETTIKDLQSSLDQLRLDMKSIEDIDASLSNRLKKLDTEIDGALQEGDHARELIDTIWYVIDDRKARELFYELQNKSLEKLKATDAYLGSDLLSDFNAVISTAQNQIDRVKQEYNRLEKEGVIIKQRAVRIKKIKQDTEDQAREKKAQEEAHIVKIKEEKKRPDTIEKLPWYNKIITFFSYLFDQVLGLFSSRKSVHSTPPLPQPKPFAHESLTPQEELPAIPAIPLS